MAKKKTPDQKATDELSFEESLEELEAIVQQLEQGGGALDQALADYEKAIGLLKHCHQRLQQAERKVEILSGVDAQGNPVSEAYTEVDASLEEKQQSRSSRRTASSSKSKPRAAADNDAELF